MAIGGHAGAAKAAQVNFYRNENWLAQNGRNRGCLGVLIRQIRVSGEPMPVSVGAASSASGS